MSNTSPAVKAYRSCGFHNRTLAELRNDSSLLRRAVLRDDNPDIAHVPNVFGKFEHNGKTYHTTLTLVGVSDEDEVQLERPSRGLSELKLNPIDEHRELWEFLILIPKKFCHEAQMVPSEKEDKEDRFSHKLTDRTSIFAMEFLCCYRFYIEQVMETYQLGNSAVRQPLSDTNKLNHPTKREVNALICRFDTIERNLEWLKAKEDLAAWDFSSIQQFLGLHVERNRTSMLSYYRKWVSEHRVDPEVVESRTMEFIAMSFLTDTHDQ